MSTSAQEHEEKNAPEAIVREVNAEAFDRRKTVRNNFYRGEFPDAKVSYAGKEYTAEVFDISPSGIGILPQTPIVGLTETDTQIKIRLGSLDERTATVRNISNIKFSGSFRLKLGLQFEDGERPACDLRRRVNCSALMPMAYCQDPITFGRTLLFNALYFRPNGIGLLSHQSDGIYVNDMILQLSLMLPARGEFTVPVRIAKIQQAKPDTTVLHCVWDKQNHDLNSAISEFLLMSIPQMSLSKLRDLGFLVTELEKAMRFRSVRSDEEFDKILQLRLETAKDSGRWLEETDHSKMTDKLDVHARQIYMEVNGRVIAAGRLVFNNGIRERSEHYNYGVELPEWLWQEGFIEASRLCTHPDYRGSSVFMQMIQHVSVITGLSGHRYVVLNCVDSLVPVYQKVAGVKLMGKRFFTEYMEDQALNLLLVDARAIQVGLNLNPVSWLVHTPVGDHLVEKKRVKLKWWERLYRWMMKPIHRRGRKMVLRERQKKAVAEFNKKNEATDE